MNPKALVTGITGQDGSYLAELLLSKGYEVHGVVRPESDDFRIAHIQSQLHLHQANLLDQEQVIRLVDAVRPQEIYNLAAMSFVPESWVQPAYTAEVTGLSCLRMLEAIRCVDQDIRFYQAGSSEMFGNVEQSPQHEETRFCPRNPYAVAKIFAYHTCANYRDYHNIFACTGILYNHESPRRGINYVTRKITMAAAKIYLGLQDQLRLGNLDVFRDWGFAGDYVESMWLMLQQDQPADFVIGTGQVASVRDFVRHAFEHLDLDADRYVTVDPAFYRPSEKNVLVANPDKASQVLGWTAKTPLQKLIALMVDYDLQFIGGKQSTLPIKQNSRAAA
jgi:GDPmannose 4,6-dehydratase